MKDSILRQSQGYIKPIASNIVFVDHLSCFYAGPSKQGHNTDPSLAPFAGKTPFECSVLLRQMCQDTGSNVDCDEFAILDERSLNDSTLLLVQEPREADGGEENSIRFPFKMVESKL